MVAAAAATYTEMLDNRAFHIEYHGFLTNHVKHAVIGLHGLGAPLEVLQRYWDGCVLALINVHAPLTV